MDDADFGARSAKGEWTPNKLWRYPEVFVWPLHLKGLVRWMFGVPGYIVPWTALYLIIAVCFWLWWTPDQLTPGLVALLLLRNAVIVAAFYGAFHWRLYLRRSQGIAFKYNAKWPATDAGTFLFRNQTKDNVFRTFTSAVPIWTAWEAVFLWAYSADLLPSAPMTEAPLWGITLLLVIPLWRDLHFYTVHRLIHWPPLYRWCHRIHHKNVNPGPWSGLSMHWFEHLLYFSAPVILLILPSDPLHLVFLMVHAGLSPAPGHAGFDKVLVGEDHALDVETYAHYLHHKHFECNYADGTIPLDRWFGSYHDGSPESLARLRSRTRQGQTAT